MKTIEKLRSGERVFIVCMGDSITEQNEQTHGKLNYVGQLAEKLLHTFGANSYILNTGIGGDTSSGMLARVERDVLRFKPDLVTLMVGMNDPVFGDGSIENFKTNVKAIGRKIKENGGEVLLLTQNPLNYDIRDNRDRRSAYPKYSEALRGLAQEDSIPLCDIYSAWEEYTGDNLKLYLSLMNDHVHPNEYGHDFIAKILFRYLGI